jgi:alkyl hydroperoxide reductase subunit F
VEKVLSHPNMTGHTCLEILEVSGDKFVSGISFKDTKSGEVKNLATTGIFVEIGMIPNTSYLEGIVELDNIKRVIIDPWTQQTKTPGIWAAGDCTNILYHQNNIAVGDAVRALEDIYVTLRAK